MKRKRPTGKRNIRNVEKYKTFIRSSKSHTERLIKLNALTMLSELPTEINLELHQTEELYKKTLSSQRERNDENTSHDR